MKRKLITLAAITTLLFSACNVQEEPVEKNMNKRPQFEYVGGTYGNNSLPVFSDEDPESLKGYVMFGKSYRGKPYLFQMGFMNTHQDGDGDKAFTLPEQYLTNQTEARIFAVDKQGLSSDTIPIYQCTNDSVWYEETCEERNKPKLDSYYWGGF